MDKHDLPADPGSTFDAEDLRQRLAAVVDSSDDAIVGKNLDGIITSWNRGAERTFGYTAAEAIGRHITLIIPEDRRSEENDVLARIRRDEKIDHLETVREAKDGRRIRVSLTVSPIHDYRGRIIGASKLARDLTDRNRRTEVEAQLAAIVDSSDDAIVSKTLDGVIRTWNRGAEQIFGYTAAEAVGRHIALIIPEDRIAEEEDVLARLRRGEKIDHFETVRQTKDGRRIIVSLTVSPIRDARGVVTGASKVARDITESVRMREALRRAHDEMEARVRERTADLERANDALRAENAERLRVERQRMELLTRLALAQEDERRRIARELHDQLGQQLTALRLTLATLKAQALERSDLRVQVETLEELSRQLDQEVAFRVWELTPSVLRDRGLSAALAAYVAKWSKHFGIDAQLHTSGSIDERLTSDVRTVVYRLAQEALNNVAKHARANRVDCVLEGGAEHLSLIVEDNGIGFDLANVSAAGQGLGLVGMRERAGLIDADLQIESAPNRGTTIIVRIPIASSVLQSA